MAKKTRERGKGELGPAPKGSVKRRRAVHVFTEGSVMEREYTEAVQALVKVPAQVHIANEAKSGSDRDPADLVRDACELLAEKRREDKKRGLRQSQLTQVWCLFDHD